MLSMTPALRVPSNESESVVEQPPSTVTELATDLKNPGLNASGLDTDGWLADESSFDLARPDDSVTIVVRGQVPLINDPAFTAELSMLVDGAEVARQTVGVGRFRLAAPVPASQEQWHVELRFSDVQRLPAPDGRRVAAHVQLIGFEAPASAAPEPGPTHPPDAKPSRPMLKPVPKVELPPPPERIFASETVIRPSAIPFRVQLREMWQYRHLFTALVWRNIRVEFDAMRLGSIWAISRPILFAVVFGFFRHLSGANTFVDVPYVPYVYTGLLMWTYFTDVATNVAAATRADMPLLTKIYYPRLLTPLVPVISGLVIFAVGMLPLTILMIIYDLHPGWMFVLLPIVLLPCITFALGLGLLVSALSIEDRDWERALAFSMTIGLWLSPVIYAPDMIPETVRNIYALNPIAGPLLAFRSVLFSGVPFPIGAFGYSVLSSSAVLVVGTFAFRRSELRLVDRL
jgi:lipopolysaccharide transport system permease protein